MSCYLARNPPSFWNILKLQVYAYLSPIKFPERLAEPGDHRQLHGRGVVTSWIGTTTTWFVTGRGLQLRLADVRHQQGWTLARWADGASLHQAEEIRRPCNSLSCGPSRCSFNRGWSDDPSGSSTWRTGLTTLFGRRLHGRGAWRPSQQHQRARQTIGYTTVSSSCVPVRRGDFCWEESRRRPVAGPGRQQQHAADGLGWLWAQTRRLFILFFFISFDR